MTVWHGPRPRIRSVLGKTGRMPRLLRLRIARRERRRRGDEADVARGVGTRPLLVRVRSAHSDFSLSMVVKCRNVGPHGAIRAPAAHALRQFR